MKGMQIPKFHPASSHTPSIWSTLSTAQPVSPTTTQCLQITLQVVEVSVVGVAMSCDIDNHPPALWTTQIP